MRTAEQLIRRALKLEIAWHNSNVEYVKRFANKNELLQAERDARAARLREEVMHYLGDKKLRNKIIG